MEKIIVVVGVTGAQVLYLERYLGVIANFRFG